MSKYYLFVQTSRTSYSLKSETFVFNDEQSAKVFVKELKAIEEYDSLIEVFKALFNGDLFLKNIDKDLIDIDDFNLSDDPLSYEYLYDEFSNEYGIMLMIEESYINNFDFATLILGDKISI